MLRAHAGAHSPAAGLTRKEFNTPRALLQTPPKRQKRQKHYINNLPSAWVTELEADSRKSVEKYLHLAWVSSPTLKV